MTSTFKLTCAVSALALVTSCAQLQGSFAEGKKLEKAKLEGLISDKLGTIKRDEIIKFAGQPYSSSSRDGGKDQGKINCDVWYMNAPSKMMIALKKSNGNIDEEPKFLTCFREKDNALIYAEIDADIYKYKELWSDPVERKYSPLKGKHFTVKKGGVELTYFPNMTLPGQSLKLKNNTSNVVSINWAETNIVDGSGRNLEVAPATYSRSNWDRPAPSTKVMPGDEVEVFVYAKDLYRMNWSTKVLTKYPLCGNVKGFAEGISGMVEVIDDQHCIGKSSGMVLTYDVAGKQDSLFFKYKLVSRKEKKKQ